MKFIKNTLNLVTSPLRKRTDQLKSILRSVESQKRERLSDKERIEEMKRSRQALLTAWGIEDNEEEIAKVGKGLYLETILFTGLAIMPVVSLFTDFKAVAYWLAFATATPFCLYVATTKVWRYECLKVGRLVPYSKWFFNGINGGIND